MSDSNTVSLQLLQRQVDILQLENHTLRGKRTDGGNPPGGGMDSRISNLEQNMTDSKVSLGRMEVRLGHIEENMLTKGRAAVYALASLIAVGTAVLGGGWWVVQQYLSPILAAIPK